MEEIDYSSWVEVDLAAITSNVGEICAHTGAEVMAIVKANAYGHGAVPVARAALKGGASWCGAANIDEALELRASNVLCPILLLGFTPISRFKQAILDRISITVWNIDQIDYASAIAGELNDQALLHLKVDTGMSRLGVQIDQVITTARYLVAKPNVKFQGLFTHFARADENDPAPTEDQNKQFKAILEAMEQTGLRPELAHAANSAAALSFPNTAYDIVRLGIAMYGLHPSRQRPILNNHRPALTWKSTLSQVKSLPAGRGISYGHQYITGAPMLVGTIPVGYADGYRRTAGNQVLINGHRLPVIGRVCMDQIMVDLDQSPSAKEGDEVVLIGKQGDETISAEDLADKWGTINYEVVSGIGCRVKRIYK